MSTYEAKMNTYEAKMNALVRENRKLKDDLAATGNELTKALARIGATERDLLRLEVLESRLDNTKDEYERLSSLLTGDNLFNSEKFRTVIQSEVKSGFGYYWPSLKTDMRDQLWKELPPPVKEYMEMEKSKLTDEVVLIRSALVSLQQKSTASESAQDGAPAISELKKAIERIEMRQEEFESALRGSTSSAPRLGPKSTLLRSGSNGLRLSTPLAIPLPNLPPKPPAPWSESPRHGPQQRRGAETSPTASDQSSHPFHQGPDDEVNVPTQDPRRRSAAVSRSPPIVPPTPTCLSHLEPSSPQSATSRTLHEQMHLSTAHPPRVAQLEINGSSPVINHEHPVINALSPRRSASMPHSETTSSIPTQPPTGMHTDRIALLFTGNRPQPPVTPAQPQPRITLDYSHQPLPLEDLPADRSRSLPTYFSRMNATVSPRDGPASSSSRIPVDDVTTLATPIFPPLAPLTTPPGSDNRHIPTQSHRNPNQSPSRGTVTQKRKASDAFPLPKPPKPQKMHKAGGGSGTGGPGAAKSPAKSKKRRNKWKKKRGTNPGPPNLPHQGGKNGVGGNDDHACEDGEGYGGLGFPDEPDHDPAYPHRAN